MYGRTLAIAGLLAISMAAAAVGAPLVQMELATEPGFPITGAHQWMAALGDLPVTGLRIRAARDGEGPKIETSGDVYRVTGILTQAGKLRLPGASFSRHEKARIADWIDRLAKDGADQLAAPKGAFGLTGEQLLDVHRKLAVPVRGATRGQTIVAVARRISQSVDLTLSIDPSAREALRSEETVADELSGITAGTAMAATIRPLGLVLVPVRPRGGQVQLLITDARQAPEAWPIGWPPEQPLGQLVPKMFEFVPVEIADTPLPEALAELQTRLEMPFLMDQNSMARHRIDPAAVQVSLPQMRTFYKRIVDRLLAQAKLKSEVRVDEADQPLLWITTIKR